MRAWLLVSTVLTLAAATPALAAASPDASAFQGSAGFFAVILLRDTGPSY